MTGKSVVLAGMGLLLAGGCALMPEPYRETVVFDLALPAVAENTRSGVEFGRILNLTPAGRKMLFREADNRLREAPYLAWSQSPEAMLRRYLMCRFAPDGNAGDRAARRVELTLLTFELDAARQEAALEVEYQLEGRTGTARFTAPLEEAAGAAASRAMSRCAAGLADHLEQVLAAAPAAVGK